MALGYANEVHNSTGPSGSVSVTKTVAADSVLLLFCNAWVDTSGTNLTITDNNSNTWVEWDERGYDTVRRCISGYVEAANAGSTQVTVTVTGNSSSYFTVCLVEITGAKTASAVDDTSFNTGTGTAPNSGNLTSVTTNTFWAGSYYQDSGSQDQSPGTGYTEAYSQPNYSDMIIHVEYEIVSGTKTDNADWSVSVGYSYVAVAIAIGEAAAGGISIPVVMNHLRQQQIA